MAVRTHLTTVVSAPIAADAARPYQEGIVAGLIGAATITLWCLLVDAVSGRLFATASALGAALFDGAMPIDSLQKTPVSMEMAMMFIWLRAMAFMAIGGVAAHLVSRVERNPSLGFGFALLGVVFGFAFTIAGMLLAAPILKEQVWPVMLFGNLFGAVAMAGYFRQRHPRLTIEP